MTRPKNEYNMQQDEVYKAVSEVPVSFEILNKGN